MFYNARYYSSYLNRWIQPDTIVPDPKNPQSLNRYAYTYNNPIKYTDPTGHCVLGGHWMSDDTSACGGGNNLVGFSGDWEPQYQNVVNSGASTIAQQLAEFIGADQDRTMQMVAQTGYHAASTAFSHLTQLWGRSSEEIFQAVFGDITFVRSANNCASGCWAETQIPNITVYANAFGASYLDWGGQNAAHELGHAFAQRASGQPYTDLASEWNRNPNFPTRPAGFAGDFPGWQQSTGVTANEEFADMFLGFAYNQWEEVNGVRTAAANARSQWMTTNMAGWIALAVNQ